MSASDRTYKLESDLEDDCVDDAVERGWLVVKLDKVRKGWPDRCFIGFAGIMFLVEFKLPGKKPTPLQRAIHDKLKARGHPVSVIDNRADFHELLDGMEQISTTLERLENPDDL